MIVESLSNGIVTIVVSGESHVIEINDNITSVHSELSNLDYATAGHTGFQPQMVDNENYVTDNQLIEITHDNRSTLDLITEALKSAYDGAVTWISTNGSNLISHLTDLAAHASGLTFVKTGQIRPLTDSTNAIGITKADGTGQFVFVDSTNKKVSMGNAAPAFKLDIQGISSEDMISSNIGFNINQVADAAAPTLISMTVGGAVEVGTHYYYVTYTTAIGETKGTVSAVVTVLTGNQTVNLNIPISTDERVTGRKIYRTKANTPYYESYFLATIANNSDTVYSDVISDISLTTGHYGGIYNVNTTNRFVTLNNFAAMAIDENLTAFGKKAGESIQVGGILNTLFGSSAGGAITTSQANTLFGHYSGYLITTGNDNHGFGTNTLDSLTTGSGNIAIGKNALFSLVTGSYNSAIGYLAGFSSSGSYNIYLGNFAGRYETTDSNKLIIDSIARGSQAASRLGALIYGEMSSTTANQLLHLGGGGVVDITNILNTKSGSWLYLATTPTADTVGDTRFSSQSGIVIWQECTVANATKGAGTWIALNRQMVQLINKTGANSVKGSVVSISDTTDNAFRLNPIDGDMPIGVVYQNGVADGSLCLIITGGIAEVLLVDGVASTRSYIGYSSSTVAGRIDTSASVPAALLHFREIGHTLESKTGGTNILCKCIIHFN